MAISIKNVIIVQWFFLIVEILVVGLKVWIDIPNFRRRSIAISSGSLFFGLVGNIVGNALNTAVLVGMQDNIAHPSESGSIKLLKMSFSLGFFYFVALYAVKACLLGLYFAFFGGLMVQRSIAIPLWISVGYVISGFLATILLELFTCFPVSRNWSLGPDYCTPAQYTWIFGVMTSLSISTDLLVLGIPIALLLKIRLSNKYNFAIGFVLCLGLVSVVSGLVRVGITAPKDGNETVDPAVAESNLVKIMFWSEIEVFFGFLAACLPSYVALFRRRKADTTQATSEPTFGKTSQGNSKATDDTIALTNYSQIEAWERADSGRSFG